MRISERVRSGGIGDHETLANEIAAIEEKWRRAVGNFGRRAAEVEWLHTRIEAIGEWVSRDDVAAAHGEMGRYRRELIQQLAEALKSGDAEVYAEVNADVERRAVMQPVDRGVGLPPSKRRLVALELELSYHAVQSIKHKDALESLRRDVAAVVRVLHDAEFRERFAAPEQTKEMTAVVAQLLSRAVSEFPGSRPNTGRVQ